MLLLDEPISAVVAGGYGVLVAHIARALADHAKPRVAVTITSQELRRSNCAFA
jgi:hypothetical protein